MDITMEHKITFVRFCFASAFMLHENLGLSTEKLICLYKECIEMARHCSDMITMMDSCIQFVLHSYSIGRHADSLRYLKAISQSAVGIPSHELLIHKCLSMTYNKLKEFDNAVLHGKKWIEITREMGDKENEMYGHREIGKAFLSLACYDDVVDCGKKCLEIAQEIDSKEGQMMAYDCIIAAYTYMQKHDDIILYAHKLLDCAMKTNDMKYMMTAYAVLGRAHLSLNNYQDAIDSWKKCIEVARQIEDRCAEVSAYVLMGQVYNTLSDYENAIIYCKKCVKLAITIGDKHAEANAHNLLGSIYHSLGKYDDAIFNCNKCLRIHKKDNEGKAADAVAYLTLGSVNEFLEKYDEAIQNFKQCIDIVDSIGSEKKAGTRACLCLVKIYKTLKQYDDAVQYCKKSLDISKEADNKHHQMEGHFRLAQICMDSMQLNDMSLSIDTGMAIATELGHKEFEATFKEIRSALYTIVGLHDKACDTPSIKEFLEVSTCSEDDLLEDLAQAVNTCDKIMKSRALFKLYRFYCYKNDSKKAINCLEQLKEMDVDRSTNLFCFTEIGNSYQLMGQNDKALRCFKEGLPTVESCSDNGQRSKFYNGIGKLLVLLNKELNLAERYLREAIRCFEAIFTTLGSRDEFKISIFDDYIYSFKLLALLLIKGKRVEEALLVLDRCRARALIDLMISNYKMEQEGSNDEHLEYSDVLSLVTRNDFSISYYSLCFDSILNFSLEREVTFHLKFYPNVKVINKFLQKYVDTLFDEFGLREVVDCEDRSLDKEQDIQTEEKRNEKEYEGLDQTAASLLNLASKRGESNENSAETKGSTLEVLFQILECDRILLSKQDEVVIIPEGLLYQVPFPALRDPRTGKYLSETKRIRLAPSLATLKHFEDFPTDQTSNAKPLIIGSPLVGKVMMDGEEEDIEPLFGALDEAIDIAALLGVSPIVAANATKPVVLEKLREGVSVVHIAAHGILSKATIVLAPSDEIRARKIPDEEDYMLTMADVQQAKIRAQLVVLSCCHSGRGEIRAEGVVGMCRAFLASGARAVVASLWAIDDEATLEFMVVFYGHLKIGKSASTSLQLTINEMRNTRSKPKYWAPFFLMGDDVTLKFT